MTTKTGLYRKSCFCENRKKKRNGRTYTQRTLGQSTLFTILLYTLYIYRVFTRVGIDYDIYAARIAMTYSSHSDVNDCFG